MHDFQSLEIAEVKRETPEAVSISFAIPEALRDAFRFRPGQHLPVRATIGGEEQRRTYSICSCPGDARLRIAIKRVADGCFSNWANATLRAGSTLEVMPPAGRFVLPEGDGKPRHVVAFAAGAGITPIIAMIQHALANEPATSFTLVYGNRTLESILFREELEDLKDRYLGRFTLLHVLSRNEESSAPLLEGRITSEKVAALAATLFKPAEVAHVFLCGPGSMIKEALASSRRAAAHFHHAFIRGLWSTLARMRRKRWRRPPHPNPLPRGRGSPRAVARKAPRRLLFSTASAIASSCRPEATWSTPRSRPASACPTRARAGCAAPAAPGSSRVRWR
jgi:ring-1,2-phenylacetyl-CoA epoxidase subunit PaaE